MPPVPPLHQSTVSLLPIPAIQLNDLSAFNVPLLAQLALDVNFAIGAPGVSACNHNHFKLSIEVKEDASYQVSVESWERTLDECATEKVKKRAGVDESTRTIAVEICTRSVRKLIKELKFCLAALQLFTDLNQAHLHQSYLYAQVRCWFVSQKQVSFRYYVGFFLLLLFIAARR